MFMIESAPGYLSVLNSIRYVIRQLEVEGGCGGSMVAEKAGAASAAGAKA